ncbi:MAG: hypothetical protein ABI843_03385 [Dokdonella sp.]
MSACNIPAVHAKDAFVVISGGGSPTSNHYSQYLQARAYVTYLKSHYADEQVWVFFGAGNVEGQAPVLSDVEQTIKDDKGHATAAWIAGALPGNRPALRDVLARAFRDEILPAVHDGGTLFLFVGDHGGPSAGANPESIISLWSWDRDPTLPFGWRNYDLAAETLGVAELRRWLSAGLGEGRVVFVMSQCYSGGFHYLGVPREVAVNPFWFTHVPEWASATEETKNMPPVAGFTATDDHSVASGCTSDVSADHWAGYERYLPENLLGLDLFTLTAGAQPARASIYEAHLEAVLADQTIDKPSSTSEQYLDVWAQTIARMQKEKDLAAAVKAPLQNFHATMDGKEPRAADAQFKQRRQEYQRQTERMVKQNPELKDLVQESQEELEGEIGSESGVAAMNRLRRGDRVNQYAAPAGAGEDSSAEDMQWVEWLWARKIAPAWLAAVDANEVGDLSAPVLAFEREMASIDVREATAEPRAGAARGIADPALLIYFRSGYADPATFDPARAKAISDWVRKRRKSILDWARKSKDAKVRAGAEAYAAWVPPAMIDPDAAAEIAAVADDDDANDEEPTNKSAAPRPAPRRHPLKRGVAAERIYFHRRVLAAWQFLLEVHEQAALQRVAALTQLERTPLPVATRKAAQH